MAVAPTIDATEVRGLNGRPVAPPAPEGEAVDTSPVEGAEALLAAEATSAEATAVEAPEVRAATPARARSRTTLRALEAQRWIDWLTLHFAPACAAALIAYSHMREIGEAVIVFAAVLGASQLLVSRTQLPLALMPAARIVLGLAAPLLGGAAAWFASSATGAPYPIAQYEAVVLGAWLVLALGVWLRARLEVGIAARVAVIGRRDFAADLATELAANGVRAYDVVGWIGDEGPAQYHRLKWLGSIDDVRTAVLEERIELLVCAPGAGESTIADPSARVAESCLDLPVRLIAANQLYEETFGHVPIGTIDSAWYRYIMHPRFRAASPLSKRVFDLVVGGAIAALTLPFLVIAMLAIKISDGGPVLYRQIRLGENGQPYAIIKLRTMRVDAERAGPQWAQAGDERVTGVGRVLRRTHIDEVPQLWNVLRGEMTLVGPRPERPEIVADLERRFPHYTRRHLVKPGIAGWAALRCGYAGSDLGTAWKLCHDLFYIKHRSILADAMILVETAIEAFRDAHRALRAPDERFLIGRENEVA